MFGIADYGAFVAAIVLFLAIQEAGKPGLDHVDKQKAGFAGYGWQPLWVSSQATKY